MGLPNLRCRFGWRDAHLGNGISTQRPGSMPNKGASGFQLPLVGSGSCGPWHILIGLADVLLDSRGGKEDSTSGRESVIGILLIVAQCIFSVLQDIAEETFMQAGEFSPILLLGMEGAFGFVVALILFFALSDAFGNGPTEIWEALQEDKTVLVGYSIGLTLLFVVTGVFNVKATQVTSAMTAKECLEESANCPGLDHCSSHLLSVRQPQSGRALCHT